MRFKFADAPVITYALRRDAWLDELMARPPTGPAGVEPGRAVEKVRRHLFAFVPNRAVRFRAK
ncbi:MAG: hypothetical protein ACREDD_09755 [Methylocella sp.]